MYLKHGSIIGLMMTPWVATCRLFNWHYISCFLSYLTVGILIENTSGWFQQKKKFFTWFSVLIYFWITWLDKKGAVFRLRLGGGVLYSVPVGICGWKAVFGTVLSLSTPVLPHSVSFYQCSILIYLFTIYDLSRWQLHKINRLKLLKGKMLGESREICTVNILSTAATEYHF
jgi:hypothetical protein